MVPQHRDLPPQRGEVGDGGEERAPLLVEVPVQPGHLVVLAVGVVVAAVGATDLVTGGDHRHARREQERAEEAAHRPAPRVPDDRVVGGPFDAVVPRPVVVRAVAVVLAVGLVVLLVVGDEVGEGEAVVRRDEVDRGQRSALGEEVPAADEPRREVADPVARLAPERHRPRLREPELACRVAEAVVPLRPGAGELPGPPPVRPDVPRLGDVLHPREHGVLGQRDEEGVLRVELEVPPSPECDGQVVPEAVDVALAHPVAQRVQHHLAGVRVAEVEGVAAAGDVDVHAVLVEPVGVRRGQSPPGDGRAGDGLLGGVVVHDVEEDLDPRRVQQLDHALELAQHLVRVIAARVGRVRREVADRVVAPVVGQPELAQVRLVGVRVHRQQLERGDAEPAQVLDGHRVGQPRVGPAEVLGHPRQPHRHLPHVRLVDHSLIAGGGGGGVLAPVKGRVDDDAPRDEGGGVHGGGPVRVVGVVGEHLGSGSDLPFDRAGEGVEEQLGRGEAVPRGRVPRALGPQPVAGAGSDVRHEAGEPAVPGGGQRVAGFLLVGR